MQEMHQISSRNDLRDDLRVPIKIFFSGFSSIALKQSIGNFEGNLTYIKVYYIIPMSS